MLRKQQEEHILHVKNRMSADNLERATFGAGCFWGVEYAFAKMSGVQETAVGYAGGQTKFPTYRQVCAGGTGHAEVVEVLYDPKKTSYRELLRKFFEIHDPTTVNRQGPDIGDQYRSVIFYHDERQQKEAKSVIDELEEQKTFNRPIVTRVEPAPVMYKAEEYHQKYSFKNKSVSCG